ncbi:FAD-dependent oxidoreductase [Actinosynnema sp. NPDC051121]
MANVDVAVVGNGVLGLSVAVEVARRAPELRIAVIGPPDRPGAATAAAGAMLNCFGEVTRHTGGHPAARAKFALARETLDRWPQWLGQLADEAGPEAGGAALRSHSPNAPPRPTAGNASCVPDHLSVSQLPGPAAPRTSSARPTAARAAECTSCRCPGRAATTSAPPTSSPPTSPTNRRSAPPRP